MEVKGNNAKIKKFAFKNLICLCHLWHPDPRLPSATLPTKTQSSLADIQQIPLPFNLRPHAGALMAYTADVCRLWLRAI